MIKYRCSFIEWGVVGLTHGSKMKLAVKDTVFRDLFSQKKYLLQSI